MQRYEKLEKIGEGMKEIMFFFIPILRVGRGGYYGYFAALIIINVCPGRIFMALYIHITSSETIKLYNFVNK